MNETISVFDILKIGVGPSSSHTIGPWRAANQFSAALVGKKFDTVHIELFGSLAKTGKGHCTDVAVQLGLEGYIPSEIDTQQIPLYLERISTELNLYVNDTLIYFSPKEHIIFSQDTDIPHPNTVRFTAYQGTQPIYSETYYSVGGGFIQKEGEALDAQVARTFPFPSHTGRDLLQFTQDKECSIADIVFQNELSIQPAQEIRSKLKAIYETMLDCVYAGCITAGVLPGGLYVQRRAKYLCDKLLGGRSFSSREEWMTQIQNAPQDFNSMRKWVSCFALAVNEENASLGRVVTAPTNGAAGVIPAVLLYYYFFCSHDEQPFDYEKFLLTASEIGSIFKKGATISAAVGGCQAEIGVSSSMAAAGLTAVLGGTPKQVLIAAEIAMEHHLGLTCDPIGGLVQIPCIERNAMGAIKAITASDLALSGNPDDARVELDVVVKSMWDTACAMSSKYKETSEGGLAINLPVIYPEC